MAATKRSAAAAATKNGTATGPQRRGSSPRSRAHWEHVKSILGAILIFLVVRTFLIEAYRIPSGSMIPSLLVGDWLFVNKLVYGPHIPFTRAALPGYAEPRRGEVVVFRSPPQIDQPWDPNPTLVKRLVGMPGDTLFMREGTLHVNGVPHPQEGAAVANPVGDPNEVSPLFDWQKPLGLRASRFGPAPAQPTHDHWGPFVVPERHFFMLGDNRYNSKDSRYWGFVPRGNLRGRPLFVYYSYDAENSDSPAPYLTDIRWRRIGHRIR